MKVTTIVCWFYRCTACWEKLYSSSSLVQHTYMKFDFHHIFWKWIRQQQQDLRITSEIDIAVMLEVQSSWLRSRRACEGRDFDRSVPNDGLCLRIPKKYLNLRECHTRKRCWSGREFQSVPVLLLFENVMMWKQLHFEQTYTRINTEARIFIMVTMSVIESTDQAWSKVQSMFKIIPIEAKRWLPSERRLRSTFRKYHERCSFQQDRYHLRMHHLDERPRISVDKANRRHQDTVLKNTRAWSAFLPKWSLLAIS